MDKPLIAGRISQLKDENYFVRRNAAEALGKIGDAASVPALIEALMGWTVPLNAAEALVAITQPETLLRGVSGPQENSERPSRFPAHLQRLFGKRANTGS